MDDSEDELLLQFSTSCLLRATASRLSVTLNLLPSRRRTLWVRNYLKKRNKYSVYRSLLPDLATFHRQKITNFLRMDVDDFEELFRLVEPAIKKKTTKFR